MEVDVGVLCKSCHYMYYATIARLFSSAGSLVLEASKLVSVSYLMSLNILTILKRKDRRKLFVVKLHSLACLLNDAKVALNLLYRSLALGRRKQTFIHHTSPEKC